jgi:hypothetical protein
MAKRTKPPRKPGGPIKLPVNRFEIPALAGTFAYKFNGYAIKQERPFYVLGVGQFTLDREGNITGEHQSSATAMGGEATVMTGTYTLNGMMSVARNGAGRAGVFFNKADGRGKSVAGGFHVQVAGDVDRIWMISSKAIDLVIDPSTGLPPEAVELCSMEAVRMALPKP